MSEVATHPIQTRKWRHGDGRIPQVVTLAAYEVYSHIYGKQDALITGECRGGFGAGELLAFLYARPFPKSEWEARVQEALRGLGSA